jgi:hypothetical protein
MKTNKWKTIAIVFICLFLITFFGSLALYKAGIDSIERETECTTICFNKGESYYFDYFDNICYCYQDEEIIYQKVIK